MFFPLFTVTRQKERLLQSFPDVKPCYILLEKDIILHCRSVLAVPASIQKRRSTVACEQYLEFDDPNAALNHNAPSGNENEVVEREIISDDHLHLKNEDAAQTQDDNDENVPPLGLIVNQSANVTPICVIATASAKLADSIPQSILKRRHTIACDNNESFESIVPITKRRRSVMFDLGNGLLVSPITSEAVTQDSNTQPKSDNQCQIEFQQVNKNVSDKPLLERFDYGVGIESDYL